MDHHVLIIALINNCYKKSFNIMFSTVVMICLYKLLSVIELYIFLLF